MQNEPKKSHSGVAFPASIVYNVIVNIRTSCEKEKYRKESIQRDARLLEGCYAEPPRIALWSLQ